MLMVILTITFTESQKKRLKQLNVEPRIFEKTFENEFERDEFYKKALNKLQSLNKKKIKQLFSTGSSSILIDLENKIRNKLVSAGYVEVVTPILLPKTYIVNMGILPSDGLWRQIVWTEGEKCLRPMLAPNLYVIMRRLRRINDSIRIFEIGTCFRREEDGSQHLTEFTMCNAVCFPINTDPALELQTLINLLMSAVEISEYKVIESFCQVYGKTLDIEVDGMEVCSCAIGPISIDANWGIFEPWIGIGMGLERALMIKHNLKRIKPLGRSLNYLNGISIGV